MTKCDSEQPSIKPPPVPGVGRPSSFSQEIGDAICEGLCDGRSLRSICLADDMPNKATVLRWLANNDAFRDQYTRAREAQADAIFDDIQDIADDGSNDWMERRREDGTVDEVLNHEHVQRSKLRVDARKWMASKLAPKKYGEKLQLAGDDGGALRIEVVQREIVYPAQLTHRDG